MNHLIQSKYINILSLIGVIILGTLSIFSDVQIKRLSSAYGWVEHTYLVITIANRLPFSISELETQSRNYLLTRDPLYQKEFEKNLQKPYEELSLLEKLTQDDPLQQERVQNYRSRLNIRLTLLKETIKIGTEKGTQAAITNILQGRGKALTEELKSISDEIINEEVKLLKLRTDATKRDYENTNFVINMANLLSILFIISSILLLNRQIYIQRRTENKLRKSENHLLQLAYYEPLTGLPNRTLLFTRLDEMLSEMKTYEHLLAFLLIDIDNFKSVNDSSGYEEGDKLIVQFAKRLVNLFGKENFIAHLGTDRFVIVLQNVNHISDIAEAAQLILDSTKKALLANNHQWYVSVSIGISVFPNNGNDAKTLMKNADIALYHAKELGKNNYQFCTQEMTIAVEERALLDTNLHEALINDEFVLRFQPKINLHTNSISGIEALIRWKRPGHGFVNPIHFISLAESNGLIVPLGNKMLREACSLGAQWQKENINIHIAINISTRQLIMVGFIESVRQILVETGFDPHLLEFEITESVLLEHSVDNLSLLKKLKKMGIQITIDDFGTGYSSLNYLTAFDVNKLKIDKSFIDEITNVEQEHSIITAIIVMAHSLGISVVAEGVEHSFQAEFLKRSDCDEAQGFFYSKPLSAEHVLDFINSYYSKKDS